MENTLHKVLRLDGRHGDTWEKITSPIFLYRPMHAIVIIEGTTSKSDDYALRTVGGHDIYVGITVALTKTEELRAFVEVRAPRYACSTTREKWKIPHDKHTWRVTNVSAFKKASFLVESGYDMRDIPPSEVFETVIRHFTSVGLSKSTISNIKQLTGLVHLEKITYWFHHILQSALIAKVMGTPNWNAD